MRDLPISIRLLSFKEMWPTQIRNLGRSVLIGDRFLE